MSDLIPAITARRAYRAMDARRIPEEIVDRVLHAATLAPSCANNQPWRFIAVTDSAALAEIKQHLNGGNYWAKLSPCIVLVCANPDDDCRLSDRRDYALFDLGMAAQNLMLQGVKEGLYTHPIAGFKPAPIIEAFGIPEDVILVTLIILAYPGSDEGLSEKHQASEHGDRVRKPREDVVAYDRWPSRWST